MTDNILLRFQFKWIYTIFLKGKKLNALYHDYLQVKKLPFFNIYVSNFPLDAITWVFPYVTGFFQGTPYGERCRIWYVHEGCLIDDWLIDCEGFYAVSAIYQPFNGGDF